MLWQPMTIESRPGMGDLSGTKQFGYRAPRYDFPHSITMEITRDGTTRTIAAQGIDISTEGIAVGVSEPLDFDQTVMLDIPRQDGGLVRVAGRQFYHCDDHYGFAFDFRIPEESEQVREIVSRVSGKR
jgi:PilZ domain